MERYSRAVMWFVFAALLLCGLSAQVISPARTTPLSQQIASPQPSPVPEQSQPGVPVFRGQTTEVDLAVTVTDDRGKFVSDLTRDDFRVLDEGKPQRIEFFSHSEKQPVVVGFLVDLSNASKLHWPTYKDAIKNLIWTLLPDDPHYSGYLITYTQEAVVSADTTIHGNDLTERLDKLTPGGGAALYDAIYLACRGRKLVQGEPSEPRRVIIVIGDGHNSYGSKTLDEVLEIAKRDQVTIFAVSTVSNGMDNESEDILKQLTKETGGRVEYPLRNPFKDFSGYLSKQQDAGNYQFEVGTGGYELAKSKAIVEAIQSIQGEITSQYVLHYKPDIGAGSKEYRHVKVEIPSLPNVQIRTRSGYYPYAPPADYEKPTKPIGIASPTAAKPSVPPSTPVKPDN
jgi:VWFA-related protein